MRALKTILVALLVLVASNQLVAQDYGKLSKFISQAKGDYVGSESCGVCHAQIHDWWFGSGHAHKLRDAEEARGAGVPPPDSVSWDDIKWVIGGFNWKARFIGNDGYIITKGGMNQFNLANRGWTDYHPDETKKYDCGPCHMTNYKETGRQEFLPGVVGRWTFPSVHCEECHGPGKQHILTGGSSAEITVDKSTAGCGKCHYRTDPAIIPASGGFIRHHEQYNEILKSNHGKQLNCVTCHDPHKTGSSSIKITCADCHADVAGVYEGSHMGEAGVTCEDCHMPLMTKSAISLKKWVGDVKTHMFKINLNAGAKPFTSDGAEANGYVTSEFACLVCHYDRDKTWAAGYKGVIHGLR